MTKLRRDADELNQNPPTAIGALLGIEGRAALAYFAAWQGVPIKWKGIGRHPIPDDWYQIGPRQSQNTRKKGRNRHASHPVNAMLNYAYAVLESQVRIQIALEGYNPTIGFLHSYDRNESAFVFDLMEPLRPVVDRAVLKFVQLQTFHPADFTIRSDGACRLNPEMARRVVATLPDTGFRSEKALTSSLLRLHPSHGV